MKVAIYARVSTSEKEQNVETQLMPLKELCTAQGWQILAEYVDSQEEFPKLRFYDSGLVSMNDRCPVRRTRLSAKMPAAYVNGRPIGFC